MKKNLEVIEKFYKELKSNADCPFGYIHKMPKCLGNAFRSFIKTPSVSNFVNLDDEISFYQEKREAFEECCINSDEWGVAMRNVARTFMLIHPKLKFMIDWECYMDKKN